MHQGDQCSAMGGVLQCIHWDRSETAARVSLRLTSILVPHHPRGSEVQREGLAAIQQELPEIHGSSPRDPVGRNQPINMDASFL